MTLSTGTTMCAHALPPGGFGLRTPPAEPRTHAPTTPTAAGAR